MEWVKPGHRAGSNTHNVSATVSIKPDEWEGVGEWMWENRQYYNGLSVLPFDNGSYTQAPFTDCTEEVYLQMMEHLKNINLSGVVEMDDATDQRGELACGPLGCEIK